MRTIKFALFKSAPVMLSYLFIGIAAGLLLREAGYSPAWAFLSATVIYAGSMQIVMVGLLTSGASLITVAVTTMFVNARHVFYGVGFIDEFRRVGGWRRIYMTLALTDETYSLLCALDCPEGVVRGKCEFWILALCHATWILSCCLGAAAGDFLPFDTAGIEFSATALFTAVAVEQWRSAKSRLPAIIGLASAVLFYFVLGPEGFLLPALGASAGSMYLLRGCAQNER